MYRNRNARRSTLRYQREDSIHNIAIGVAEGFDRSSPAYACFDLAKDEINIGRRGFNF